jgi:hypothetical protein
VELDATVFASAVFLDRAGGRSQFSGRLPSSLSEADAFDRWEAVTTAAAIISNAVVEKLTIAWRSRELEPAAPDPASDTTRRLLLFYRNEAGTREMFAIPSPAPGLFETDGFYAGVRVNISDSSVADAIDSLSAALSVALTAEGDDWPPTYTVGGLAL